MSDTQKWQLLAVSVVLGVLLWLLAPVLTPFAVVGAAGLISLIRSSIASTAGKLNAYRLGLAVRFGADDVVHRGRGVVADPDAGTADLRLHRTAAALYRLDSEPRPALDRSNIGVDVEAFDPASLIAMLKQHWQKAGGVAATILGGISKSGLAVLGWIANLLLIPVVTFYFLRDWDVLVARVRVLLPRPIEPTISQLARESDGVLGRSCAANSSVMLALGAVYSIGLWMSASISHS